MSTDVNVQEAWTIEPELAERPPRRLAPSDYPDLNQPNALILYGIGGVAAVAGIVLLIMGLSGSGTLFVLLGLLLAAGGAALLVFAPMKVQKHKARVEYLATNGVPVMARILSADNLTGDSTFARSVTYQVTTPGGDLAHRSCNVDERALPRRIPANVTALMDINSQEVELYCALPFRAVSKNTPVSAHGTATTSDAMGDMPTTVPAGGKPGMGTIGVAPNPVKRPAQEKPDEDPQTDKTKTKAGLPWE